MITAALRATVRPDVDAQADFDATPEAAIVYAERSSRAEDPWEKGKEKGKGKGSRWNAVRHGCMAKLLLPADLEIEAAKRTAALTELHRPTNEHERRIIANMGRIAAQLDRTQQLKVVDLQRTMDRAVLCWDEDRDNYVFALTKDLGKVPGVATALAQTKQGAEWLLKTWRELDSALDTRGKWSEEESRLVLYLLEVRAELQAGFILDMAEEDTDGLRQIVTDDRKRIERLLERGVLACDDADRWLAAAGMPQEENAGTKRLRKQERQLKLEFRRYKEDLLDGRARAAAAAAGPVETPATAEAPVVSATRREAAEKPAPRPRPSMSDVAWNYHVKRQDLNALELPETADSPAQRVEVRFPFVGGDPEPEPPTDDECEAEAEFEDDDEGDGEADVVLTDMASARRPTACATSHASRGAVAKQRRDRDRKSRRDQEKKARKAARRKRR